MLQKIRHYNNVAEICEAAPSRQNSLNTFSTQFITLEGERETESQIERGFTDVGGVR